MWQGRAVQEPDQGFGLASRQDLISPHTMPNSRLFMVPNTPLRFQKLLRKSNEIGFTMPSDEEAGALLKTLVASKPGGHFWS